MKKSALIFFSFLLLCKFSFAQKINLPDSIDDDVEIVKNEMPKVNLKVDTTTKQNHSDFFINNLYLQTNPSQWLFHQQNISIGYKSKQFAIELFYSKISPTLKNFGPWGNGDACVAHLLYGNRFTFCLKKYINETIFHNVVI